MTVNAEQSLNHMGAGMSRRTALRTGLLIGGGLAGVATGMLSSPKPANAEGAAQFGWLWCTRCQGLYYSWNGTAGRCAAGGGHRGSTVFKYWLWYDNEGTPDIVELQFLWRWCRRCQAVAYTGNGRIGWCPAGGQHNHAGSLNYGMYHDYPPVAGQPDWAWCHKCESLFYGPHQSSSSCPQSGRHQVSVTFNYTVGYTEF
jgi:hypothetical protein